MDSGSNRVGGWGWTVVVIWWEGGVDGGLNIGA